MNLFSNRYNSAMTVGAIIVMELAVWFGLGWVIV